MRLTLLCSIIGAASQVVSATEKVIISHANSRLIRSEDTVAANINNGAYRSKKYGHRNRKVATEEYKVITNVLPGRWTDVEFRGEGLEALQSFKLSLAEPHVIDVTGYEWDGDTFDVFNYNEENNRFTLVMEATRIASDKDAVFAGTPEKAWTLPSFSHKREILRVGKYHLKFFSVQSQFDFGKAALRIQRINNCRIERKNLVVLKTFFPHRLAETACNQFNMDLADIATDNLGDALKLIHDCVGKEESVFIGSFVSAGAEHYSSLNAKSVYLRTFNKRGHGEVLYNEGGVPMYRVLCQYRKSL